MILVLAAVLGVCASLPGPIKPTLRFHARRQAPTRLGDLIQEFGLDVSDQLWDQSESVAFSPLSISSLLSLLTLGSSGTTYHQIRTALHYPNNAADLAIHQNYKNLLQALEKSKGVTVNIATRLFIQSGKSTSANFTQQTQDYYGASVSPLQFSSDPLGSMNAVNDWVKTETQGKIPQLLTQPFNPSTTFVAANTVYFNGPWENQFNPLHTFDATFNTGTSNITVPMMRTTMTIPYVNMREFQAEMIALPYEGREFAMFIVKPNGPISDRSLQDVEFALNAATINNYIANMINSTRNVALPRMRLNYKIQLKDTLKRLNVVSMFDSSTANFWKITGNDHIWVDDMIHQTVVEITETGTEAASATSISLNRIGTSNTFEVNRPVVFFIRHMKSGLNLFWGRIMKPEPLYASSR